MTNAHRHRFSIASILMLFAATAAAQAPAPAQASVEVVRVTSKAVDRQVKLPGEFQPYLAVPIYAKLPGFVKRVAVDRGSTVKQGQVLVTLEAPEMQAQIAEAQSKAQALGLQRGEAEAKLAGAQSTYDRLKAASATPGVVAENDVVVAQKTAEAAQALVRTGAGSIRQRSRTVLDAEGAVRRHYHRTQHSSRRAGRNRNHIAAAPQIASGLASAPGCRGARSAGRRDGERRSSAVYRAGISGRDVLRDREPCRARSRREDPHDGR